jgi:hypothetical protein
MSDSGGDWRDQVDRALAVFAMEAIRFVFRVTLRDGQPDEEASPGERRATEPPPDGYGEPRARAGGAEDEVEDEIVPVELLVDEDTDTWVPVSWARSRRP